MQIAYGSIVGLSNETIIVLSINLNNRGVFAIQPSMDMHRQRRK